MKDTSSYQFKLDKKKYRIGVEVFCKVLQIYPRLPNQEFVEPPSHDEMVTFIKSLGYKGALESNHDLVTYDMYQPWRTFILCTKLTTEKPVLKDVRAFPIPDSQKLSSNTRSRLFMHSIKNDNVLGILKFVAKGAATPKKARKWKQAATKPKTTSSFTADGNIISDETDDVLANIPTRRIRLVCHCVVLIL
ncbi:hypothetical protein Tco_1297661 [Tanacetum coccineum]